LKERSFVYQPLLPARRNDSPFAEAIHLFFSTGAIMKSVIQLIAFSALAAVQLAPAHAERFGFDWERPGYQDPSNQPAKSRAQVTQELAQARASGELKVRDNTYPYAAPAISKRTREAVKQETSNASNRFDSPLYRHN
jgi:Domain of unknown function (DUF4148)